MSCPGLTCAHPAPRRSCPWGRTGCCGHAPPQLPAGVGRTRPCACKNPLAARAGAQSPGARGSPVGTVGTDRGEGRTRCSLSAAPLPRPQGFFFSPRADSILQPTSVHGSRLRMDRTVPTVCSGCGHPVRRISQDGCKAREGVAHLIYCLDAQPHSGSDSEVADGLIKHPMLTTHLGTTVAPDPSPSCPGLPHARRCQKTPHWVL